MQDDQAGTATSYNFGFFDPAEPGFAANFARGYMQYYLVALPLEQDLIHYRDNRARSEPAVAGYDAAANPGAGRRAGRTRQARERALPLRLLHFQLLHPGARRAGRGAGRRAEAAADGSFARQHLPQRSGAPGIARAVDVAGFRRRPGAVRGHAHVALGRSLRADASGRQPAHSEEQRGPAAGAAGTAAAAASHRARARGIAATLVAVAADRSAERSGDRRVGTALAARHRCAGAAAVAAVRRVRRAAGVPVGIQRTPGRLGQPQSAAAQSAVPAADSRRADAAAPTHAGRGGSAGFWLSLR